MGSLYKNGRVRSFIMIFLVLFALLISLPVKKMITSGVNKRVGLFSVFLKNNTGLSFSYERLSPSLLSNFYIRNIKIFDEENNIVLTIDRTRVNYSLKNLLGGDFQKGISSITVDGVNVDADILINLIMKIKFEEQIDLNLKQIKSLIPGNIKVKNVYFEYEDSDFDLMLAVKSVSLNNPNNKNIMEIQSAINLSGEIKKIERTISGKIDLSGSITEMFEDSQLNVKLRDLTDGDIKLSKLNLHASYKNKKIEAHTIKAVNPVSLGCIYDINTGDLNLQIRSDNLRPAAVISANSRQSLIKKFKNFRLDTDTIVKYNVNQRNLNFISDTHAYLPKELVPYGLDLSFSVFGDENKAELSDFTINNQRCAVNSKLSYVYETSQLSGYIYVPQIVLDNGSIISTEFYFDPLEKGFMAFSPQLFIGDRSLTALQLMVLPQEDSYDFTFEVYDYSHLEEIEPGILNLSGSYLSKSKYVQTNITLNSIYLDTIADIASQFLPDKVSSIISKTQNQLSSFILSGDAYASTDFKTFAYNVPYIILANSQKDNQAFMVEFNGTDKNVQLDQLSFVMGKYALEASGSLDRAPDSSDMFFTADINADSIPYHFTGNIMPEIFTISGDYGTGIEVHFGPGDRMSGRVTLQNLPVRLFDTSMIITTDTGFTIDNADGPMIQIENFELEEADSSITVNPKIVLSGNVSRYGANFSSIAYTDLYSVLQGSADILLNINEKVFDSAGLMLTLRNPVTEEGITIDGSFSNPDHLALTQDNIFKNIYMNFQMQMKNFSLNRFVVQKNDNNLVSGMVFASGTLEHPYFSLNIDSFGILCAANMLRGNGNLVIEDRNLTINGINIEYTNIKIENIQAEASLQDMNLEASAELKIGSMGKTITAPLKLSVGNAIVPEGGFVPDYLTATLTATEFSGDLIKKPFPASISVMYENNLARISSSNNIGLSGTFSKDGIVELNMDNKKFLSGNISGLLNLESMNLELYDFEINLPEAFKYFNMDNLVVMDTGTLRADFVLTGNLDDPIINGVVSVISPSAKLPMITKQNIYTSDVTILAINNELRMEETLFYAKNNQRLAIDFNVFLNKWSLDHVEGNLRTYKNDQFHLNFKTPEITVAGNISADLSMYFENNILELNGKIMGENVDASARLLGLSNLASASDDYDSNGIMIITDLDIMLGTHASIQLEPVIRCVFVPNTNLKININQPADSYVINGALILKSGDLAYLSRNFYIKSGAIKFNQNDITNPMITLNAETREKDENGQTVKILLSVEDQFLKNLQPKFSSVPPKSENEIKTLLGQIVIGDTETAADFFFVASDYALQATLVRQAENKLRDLLNFDIFSLRTNFLQNTYNLSVSRNLTNGNLSIGNFLDNTTVYIGKYLGSFLYVDAMLHISLEQDKIKSINNTTGTMVFQPEIGMELESPFANIRVNMTPDLNALLKNQFVPSTSVTLSWKFTY